jgi:hypothetical protein
MKNNDPIFWPDSSIDLNIRQQMNKNYSDCINILQTQWYQADLDQRFVIGDQDLWGLIFPGVATYRRKIFNFNLTNRAIQMVSGYQRRNRKSSVCIPVISPMQKTSDQLTKCLFHVMNKAGAYQILSDCFELGALVQGLGFLSIYKDNTQDPISGDIKYRYIDMKSCLFDPYMRRHDMMDCRFFWTRQFFDKDEAATLNPQFRDEILALPNGTYRDDKFYYMPEVYQIQFPNLIAFDEYYYLSSREATFLVDKETEETQEWTGDEEQLRDLMRRKDEDGIEMRKKLATVKQMKPTVRRSIILNDRVMVDEPNPYGLDRYPVVPCLGYMTADSPYYAYKFRGVARDMRDAQYLYNRRKVTDLDILEAQQQGLKIKKGALITPDDALNQGNGRVLTIDPAFQMSDVEQMQIIPPSPTMLQMEESLKQVMLEISGAQELLGLSEDTSDLSGIATMIRQGAAVTGLQKLFDQFDEFQRIVGDLTIEMIQKNWTFGKVKQVIGEDPTAEFDNKLFFKYGCKVVPGVLTESQQQLEAQQLIYAKKELGIPVPTKRLLQVLSIQNKDELIKEIEEAEKAQNEQQQQMAQLQMQQLQVENETKMAYARSQDGLAQERIAKIQLDKAINTERLQRSEEEKTAGLLNVIKAIKELQTIDLNQLEQSLNILQQLKPQETNPQPQQQRAI